MSTEAVLGACRTQRAVLADGERTWTVIDGEHRVAEPVEQFLEYLRMLGRSPNTVKSYARALALWWQFLAVYELGWDAVAVEDLGRFLAWLRTGDSPALVSIDRGRHSSARARSRCGCRLCVRSTAFSISTASRPHRVSMSACSPACTRTSRCSSTSRAGTGRSAAWCASRDRDGERRRPSRSSR
jgi:hypothetical protein